jgi:hypothetical protein
MLVWQKSPRPGAARFGGLGILLREARRMKMLQFIVFLAFGLSGAISAAQSLRASFTPLANFAYQLDCVASVQRSCAGREDYRKLWRETLNVDPETSPDIKRWIALREKQRELTATQGGDEWGFESVYMPNRVLAAGLGARDLADYQSRLALVLPEVSVTEANAVVQSLYPRFERWWSETALPQSKTRADTLINAMASEKITREVEHINSLLGAPPAAKTLATVHLMFRPKLVFSGNTSGQNMGIESVAEFVATDRDADRLAVILHEYAHFVFSVIPKPDGLRLKQTISQAGEGTGGPLWGLLNEAQATALGNGRVARLFMSREDFEKHLAADQRFYADPLIDGAGKALLPLVDEMIAKKETIFSPQFASRYAQAVEARLGEQLKSPSAMFKEFKLIFDPFFGRELIENVARITKVSSMWAEMVPTGSAAFEAQMNTWKTSPRVVFIPANAIEKATALPEVLRTQLLAARTGNDSVTGVSMEPKQALLVVIAAFDTASALAALEALMREKTLTTKVWRTPNSR